MDVLHIQANAKINLCLHIPALRQDGYHEIDSVFQSIGLFDVITLKKAEGITIVCDDSSVPTDKTNTAYKAAIAVMAAAKVPGVAVTIEKHIPSQAGLGGGSADAAAVICGLNALYACGLTDDEMTAIGVTIGADVPFFIRGGCARARGIGEILSPLDNPFLHDVVVIKPFGGVSTPESYRRFDQTEKIGGSAADMVSAMAEKNETAYLAAVKNALEPCAFALAPQSREAVDALKAAGALAAQVTGSGSAVFGLFKTGLGRAAKEKLESQGFERVFLEKMKDTGLSF